MKTRTLTLLTTAALLELAGSVEGQDEAFRSIPLTNRITHVQPMTGIVFWDDSEHNQTDAIQLEYSYMRYGDVVPRRGEYLKT